MYGVGLMTFILFLSTMVGVPALPHLSRELGAGPTEIPIVVSAAMVTVTVAGLVTGILADRYSIRVLIAAGALLGAVTSLLCVAATHWAQLVLLRVLGGMADAISMPALLVITARLGSGQPGRFFGILRSSQGLSYVVGPALGSLFSLVSLRTPFLADGALSLLAFVAATRLLRDLGRDRSVQALSLVRGLRSAVSDKRVAIYLLMGISGVFGFGILYSFVPTKAQLAGLEAWQIGLILTMGSLVFSAISYTIGALSDRFGRRRFVIGAQGVIVLGGIGLAFSSSFWGLLLWYALFCVGETITFVLSTIYASEVFDPAYMGVSMGAFDSTMDLSLVVGPVLAVSVHRATGQITPVLLMAGIPAAFAFFALLAWLAKEDGRSEL
jgi:MFS family permease